MYPFAEIVDGYRLTSQWAQYMSRVARVVEANEMNGATTARPTRDVYVGQSYFDSTLGKPIWAKTVVAASGGLTITWVDATGATV